MKRTMFAAVVLAGTYALAAAGPGAAPYAKVVHEIPRPAASNGKWKYLEDPWKRAAGGFDKIVAEEVEHAMKGAA